MITSCLSISPNEEKRLRALEQYPFDFDLDEKQFDEITELAAIICNVPISVISIVELDKQRFKSKVGIELRETMRDISFCQYTILSDSILEIEDASKHDLFSNNPLVTGDPHIRFYAGAPLIDKDGFKLGALSVVDTKPRKLTDEQRQQLTMLSHVVVNYFELMKSESDLKKARNKVLEATQLKTDFLAMMRNEIQTPLNGIMGAAHLLVQDNPSRHQQVYLKTLQASAENLTVIANDMQDFIETEAGQIEFESIKFSLSELTTSLKSMKPPKGIEKLIAFKVKHDINIPKMVTGDPVRLAQILNNLIENAIKFIKKGSIDLEVSLEKIQDNKAFVLFSVKDTGVGIAPDLQKTILDPFSQVDQATPWQFRRTRLGLMITKRLLELQGGTIRLTPEHKKGSEFSFTMAFPLSAETQTHIKPVEESFNFEPIGAFKILLVQDDKINTQITQKALLQWGLVVDIAENGEVALDKVKENEYDLILMDIEMPVMNGYEATHQIRKLGERYSSLPILALNASLTFDVQNQVFGMEVNDYIPKPFNLTDLYAKIKKHLLIKSGVPKSLR